MSRINIITWAEEGNMVLFDSENFLEVTPSFAKRINSANMGQILKGKDVSGKVWTVRIGKRFF